MLVYSLTMLMRVATMVFLYLIRLRFPTSNSIPSIIEERYMFYLTDVLPNPNYILIGKLGVIEKRYLPISWDLKASAHYVLRYLASVILDGI